MRHLQALGISGMLKEQMDAGGGVVRGDGLV
jgi:hypothetical protein